jgi:hypothetical protein
MFLQLLRRVGRALCGVSPVHAVAPLPRNPHLNHFFQEVRVGLELACGGRLPRMRRVTNQTWDSTMSHADLETHAPTWCADHVRYSRLGASLLSWPDKPLRYCSARHCASYILLQPWACDRGFQNPKRLARPTLTAAMAMAMAMQGETLATGRAYQTQTPLSPPTSPLCRPCRRWRSRGGAPFSLRPMGAR